MNPQLYAAQNRAEQLRTEAQQSREARAARSERSNRFPLLNFRTLFRSVRLA